MVFVTPRWLHEHGWMSWVGHLAAGTVGGKIAFNVLRAPFRFRSLYCTVVFSNSALRTLFDAPATPKCCVPYPKRGLPYPQCSSKVSDKYPKRYCASASVAASALRQLLSTCLIIDRTLPTPPIPCLPIRRQSPHAPPTAHRSKRRRKTPETETHERQSKWRPQSANASKKRRMQARLPATLKLKAFRNQPILYRTVPYHTKPMDTCMPQPIDRFEIKPRNGVETPVPCAALLPVKVAIVY